MRLRQTPQLQRPLSKTLDSPSNLALLRDLRNRDGFRLYNALLEERAYGAFQALLASSPSDAALARERLHAYLETLYFLDSIIATGELRSNDDAKRSASRRLAEDHARFFGSPLFFGERASREFSDA